MEKAPRQREKGENFQKFARLPGAYRGNGALLTAFPGQAPAAAAARAASAALCRTASFPAFCSL